MQITLNGDKKEVQDGISVSGLLDNFNLNSKRVVVEVNRVIIAKEVYDSSNLAAGDMVEIVAFVGGG